MSCLASLLPVLVLIVAAIAIVAIARVVLSRAPVPPIAIQIADILLWAVVAIAALYVAFDLLSCVAPFGRALR